MASCSPPATTPPSPSPSILARASNRSVQSGPVTGKTASRPASSALSPARRFIAEMNRRAAQLGMTDTHYENPHGLPARGHQSSCRDLVKLAHAAMQNQLFRHYVNTRQHGTKVTGEGRLRAQHRLEEHEQAARHRRLLRRQDRHHERRRRLPRLLGRARRPRAHRRRPRRHLQRRPLRRCPQPLPLGLVAESRGSSG